MSRIDSAGLAKNAGIELGDIAVPIKYSLMEEPVSKGSIIRSRMIQQLQWVDAEGRLKSISVYGVQPPLRTQLELVSLFLLCLSFLASGITAVWKKPGRAATMLFGLFCAMAAVLVSSYFGTERSVQGAWEAQTVVFISTPWVLLHFSLVFPEKKMLLERHPRLLFLIYAPSALLLAAFFLGGREEAVFYPSFRSAILAATVLALLLAIVNVIHSYATSPLVRARQQMKIALLGATAGLLPFVLLTAIPEIALDRELVPASLALLATSIMLVSFAYALLQKQLLDVDAVIQRGTVYAGAAVLVLAGYLSLTFLVFWLFPELTERGRLAAVVAISVAAVLFFNPAKERIRKFVDQAFYRDRYDYAAAMGEITGGISLIPDFRSLGHFLVERVSRTLGLEGALLFVLDRNGRIGATFASGSYAAQQTQALGLLSESSLREDNLFPNPAPADSGAAFIVPLRSRAKLLGMLFLGRKISRADYTAQDVSLLFTFSRHASAGLENIELKEEAIARGQELERLNTRLQDYASSLERTTATLREAYLQIGRALTKALETRDAYTQGHSARVANFARLVGSELRLAKDELDSLELAAELHDLGKIGTPDGVLLKSGILDPQEMAEIRLHPVRSVQILSSLEFLQDILPIIEAHHEWYDGAGYPKGLRGEEIPLGARILAVADAYEAMVSPRPYRPAYSAAEALERLKRGAGTQWDSRIVEAFIKVLAAQENGQAPAS
ncbi:MAG: HD domain-containing protein [Chloroflexi bacterium]|nr:HD domain-containing protein [Chloroflexota bacterium]